MNRYKLLTGKHTVGGTTFKAGDDHLTEEHIKGLTADRFVMVGPTEGVQQSTRTESSTETDKPSYTPMTVDMTGEDEGKTNDTATEPKDWSNTQDMKAPDVISQVNESNSVKDLEALYDVEEKGQNRATVLKAIEKRVATLEG